MTDSINWLHISDIHFQPKTEWRDNESRNSLLTYLRAIFSTGKFPKPDLVFCTGDIAFGELSSSPLDEQYQQAKSFFDELLSVCGGQAPLERSRLFIVPGNHDVSRKDINADAQSALQKLASDSATHSDKINQRFSDKTIEFSDAMKRLTAYSKFIAEYSPHQADTEGRNFYARTIDIKGVNICVAGFNSAWTAAGDEDDRNLWLAAKWQFNSAASISRNSNLRIGLIHHPTDWLNQAERQVATGRISTDFDFWLHGHSHDAWVTAEQSHVTIGAGAVGAEASPEFGINMVTFNPDTSSGQIHLHTKNSRGGGWTIQPISTHAPNGIWDFELPLHIRRTSDQTTLPSSTRNDEIQRAHASTLSSLKESLSSALQSYSSQPIVWVDPVISRREETNRDTSESDQLVVDELLSAEKNFLVVAPPQYGLTCFARNLCISAWEKDQGFWQYIDLRLVKPNKASIMEELSKSLVAVEKKIEDIRAFVVDSFIPGDRQHLKALRIISEVFVHTPIVCMYRQSGIADLDLRSLHEIRAFEVIYLWSLPRSRIRALVADYNNEKYIGEEDAVTSRVIADLEVLNLHRTALNCLTLLKASEMDFDENPVNRSDIIKRILFLLFNVDSIPTYKTRPDLKDCEFVLGYFCQQLIQRNDLEFSRNEFILLIQQFCKKQLIALEISVVFDVLFANNIIVAVGDQFSFKFTYWILYFAAHRMHHDADFCKYIFENRNYARYPEIVEFYTGIDRKRDDALRTLSKDMKDVVASVKALCGLPEDLNPYKLDVWKASTEAEEKMREEVAKGVKESNLPAAIKDHYLDRDYDRTRPYNQNLPNPLADKSVASLFQIVKAASKALRNSDYVPPDIKRELLIDILDGWDQASKVILVILPMLSSEGFVHYEGANFELDGNFGETFEQRAITILKEIPRNVTSWFQDDLYSQKMSPLLIEQFPEEAISDISRHELAVLLLRKRPKNWEKVVHQYIATVKKDSFYLLDLYVALRGQYQYSFASNQTLRDIEHLIRMIATKHLTGDKDPGVKTIGKMKFTGDIIPERTVMDE